jgi:hypothetical protein
MIVCCLLELGDGNGLFSPGPVGDCESARATWGDGELGAEMSTFEVDDVSEDIRSSVSNGFSSSNVSMALFDDAYTTDDAANDVDQCAAPPKNGCSRLVT